MTTDPKNEAVVASVKVSDILAKPTAEPRETISENTLSKFFVRYFVITGALSLMSLFMPFIAMFGTMIMIAFPWLALLAPIIYVLIFAPDFFLYPLIVLLLANVFSSKLNARRPITLAVVAVLTVSFTLPGFINALTGKKIDALKATDKSIAMPVDLPQTIAVLVPNINRVSVPAARTVLVGSPEIIGPGHTDPRSTLLPPRGICDAPAAKTCKTQMFEKLSSAAIILVVRQYNQYAGWNKLNVTRIQLLKPADDRLTVVYQRTWAGVKTVAAPFLIGPPKEVLFLPTVMRATLGDADEPDIGKETALLFGNRAKP